MRFSWPGVSVRVRPQRPPDALQESKLITIVAVEVRVLLCQWMLRVPPWMQRGYRWATSGLSEEGPVNL